MSDFIEFTNEHGQCVQIAREEYEKKIIPQNLELYWDNPEMLRQFAMELVRDGFGLQGGKAADRLLELYGRIEPALNFRAVAHMQAGELDEAKKVLIECIEKYPESGAAFTNIAKILAYEGEGNKAFEALQQGLVYDPNQESAMDLYVHSFLELEQRELLLERLKELGEIEGAWRPHMVLGRLTLEDGNLLVALQAYREAIKKAGESEEVIMNVTGELGQAGYVYQLIQIAEQYWKPTFAHPFTGFNYANALLATEQGEKAIAVLCEMKESIAEPYKHTVEQFMERLPQELLAKAASQPQAEQAAEETNSNQKKSRWKFWK
ncbi:tetratricopeptide repeat protein [Brevibacillus fluminis]|uniref:tetratricopeptide repeat protein n=1 Tax=Brevibacillus fluminis TaxID=511487 RepID=UPI003F8B0688